MYSLFKLLYNFSRHYRIAIFYWIWLSSLSGWPIVFRHIVVCYLCSYITILGHLDKYWTPFSWVLLLQTLFSALFWCPLSREYLIYGCLHSFCLQAIVQSLHKKSELDLDMHHLVIHHFVFLYAYHYYNGKYFGSLFPRLVFLIKINLLTIERSVK